MESLQTQMQFYQDHIEEDGKDHGAYYGLGIIYVKMGEETGDTSYYLKALTEFNNAIQLKSDNPLYYADRSKTYILIKEYENAARDIHMIESLPLLKGVRAIYIRNVITEVTDKLKNK